MKALSKNVLIVDEDLAIQERLKNFFESLGFPVLTARDVEEAFRLLRKNFCALMLTGYTMPGISGAELIRLVKENYPYLKPKWRSTTFEICTPTLTSEESWKSPS